MSIVSLNADQFAFTINQSPQCVVKFYADWCGSCHLLQPVWQALSQQKAWKNIQFMEGDVEAIPAMHAFFQEKSQGKIIEHLPTIATFKNGHLIDVASTSKQEPITAMLYHLAHLPS